MSVSMLRTFIPVIIFFLPVLYPRELFPEKRIVISSFFTSVTDQTEEVKYNLALACDRLNGTVIQPGRTFSFNQTVGEGSAENGYVNGTVLYRGETRMEPGGGLCQVSSTLFNAFLMAGMTLIERHRHYQPVTYVPPGLDATIKYGKKDLRVRNPYKQTLYISASINGKSMVFIIYGEKQLNYRYNIETEEEEINIPLVNNNEGLRQGIVVYVFREKFLNNKLIERSLLYKDFYPPVYLK